MLVRGLIVLMSFSAATAFAAPVPKSLKASNKWDTARFKVSYQNTPFDQVLEHFAEETGLEWIGDRPALGTTSLKGLKEYNGAEFLDLLNAVLERKECTLIRHAGTFYLHPTDQPVDLEKVDTVSAEDIKLLREPVKRHIPGWGGGEEQWVDGKWVPVERTAAEERRLPKRGKTEVATLVMELPEGTKWEDIRPQVKTVLSKFGQAGVGERGEIRVTDRVDGLRSVVSVLTERPIRIVN